MSDTNKKRKKSSRRLRMWRRIIIVVLVIAALVGGLLYAFHRSTYQYVQIEKTYENEGTGDGNYIPYANGVLEYARDGIALLNEYGEEMWNQPCQMATPIAEVCNDTAAVGDKGGTSIYVFQKSGLKGEIQTTRPIERITVSSQGIVGAVLQDEETPMVLCYDAKGNVLVEQKTSLKNTGYPLDLALSEDGKTLAVSYLCTSGNGVSTKVCYYYFGQDDENKGDHVVSEEEYQDAIAPTIDFLNKDISLLVTDSSLVFYKGVIQPKVDQVVKFGTEIQSVAYNEKYVAVVVNRTDGDGYEVRLYKTNGKLIMSAVYEGEYGNIRVADGQVLLYEDNRCIIFNRSGICKFRGTLEMNIIDMLPMAGLNKYRVISAAGFHEIQLAR